MFSDVYLFFSFAVGSEHQKKSRHAPCLVSWVVTVDFKMFPQESTEMSDDTFRDRIDFALDEYRRLHLLPNRERTDRVECWLENTVVPIVETLTCDIRFREYALWPILHLQRGEDTHERRLIEAIDDEIVELGQTLLPFVSSPNTPMLVSSVLSLTSLRDHGSTSLNLANTSAPGVVFTSSSHRNIHTFESTRWSDGEFHCSPTTSPDWRWGESTTG